MATWLLNCSMKNIGGFSRLISTTCLGMLLLTEMAHMQKNVNPRAENSSQIFSSTWIYDQFNKEVNMELDVNTDEEKNIGKIMVAAWCIHPNIYF